jgi:hypothetical protein
MFQIGQEVVCIDDSDINPHLSGINPPIKKGQVYIIDAIDICPRCKAIGLSVLGKMHVSLSVCSCGRDYYSDYWFMSAKRFIPIDYAKNKEVTFEKIVKDIPVYSN